MYLRRQVGPAGLSQPLEFFAFLQETEGANGVGPVSNRTLEFIHFYPAAAEVSFS
jgi:hypothetical protein